MGWMHSERRRLENRKEKRENKREIPRFADLLAAGRLRSE
jgi:hypothetical protein